MFTAGRILGKKSVARSVQRASTFSDQWETRYDSRERQKFRCYVPFVWQSLLATVAGLVVMATGLSLCIAGFFAGHESQQQQQPQSKVQEGNNDTLDTEISGAGYLAAAGAAAGAASAGSMTSQHQQMPFIVLTYIGPVVMSFGCFALIFAFVVFCEARDLAIRYYIRSKLYSSSSCGPRHSRLPFRHDVIHHILRVTRRRAEKQTAQLPSLVAVVADRSPSEDATSGDTVDNENVKIHCRPTLLPISPGADMTTDWLLNNGMLHNESVSSSCLNRSNHDNVHVSQLDLEQTSISRSSEWLLGNGMLHTSSPSASVDKSNPGAVQITRMDFEQSTTSRYSEWLFGNGMLYAESLSNLRSIAYHHQPEFSNVHQKHLDIEEARYPGLSHSDSMLRQPSPQHGGPISARKRDDLVEDSLQDEMTVQNVGWRADQKSTEVTPLMSAYILSESDTATENVELETTSVIYAEQSQVASTSLNSGATSASSSTSSSTSSSSSLFNVCIFSEVVDDDEVTTTTASSEEAGQAMSDTVAENNSPVEQETAPVRPGSSSAESPEDRSSPTAESNDQDIGARATRRCRRPSADCRTEAERAGDGWRRGHDVKRDHHGTARRGHAGIHCPPPLPPPPTSPSIVAASGRSPRRQ